MHDSVKGTVSVDLLKTPVNKAFEYILTLNQLSYWQDGNTLIIASNDDINKLGLNKSKIKPIRVKYLDAGVVAKFLNKNVFSINKPNGSSSPNVVINPNTNDIIVFGSEGDMALAQKVVNYLDVKPEAKTFEANYAKPSDIANVICNSIFGVTSSATVPTPGTEINEENKIACSADTTVITADTLESLGTKGFQLYYNDSLRRLTLYGGTQEQIAQVAETVKKLDKKQDQVYIELSIVELSESGSKALTSTWAYSDGRLAIDAGYASTAAGSSWSGLTGLPINQAGKATNPLTNVEEDIIVEPGDFRSARALR
jgi:type II secretory pathway component GspD/PulD (secretin)